MHIKNLDNRLKNAVVTIVGKDIDDSIDLLTEVVYKVANNKEQLVDSKVMTYFEGLE